MIEPMKEIRLSKRICAVDGCPRSVHGAGFCTMHWDRWRKTGDPGPVGSTRGVRSWTVDDNDCWVWDRAKGDHGYGVLRDEGRTKLAHRWSYERNVGPIPDGMHLDHLCRNRACVNPAHLEPVTPAENLRRGRDARTHCKRGHELTPDNLWYPPNKGGGWLCRECVAHRRRERYACVGSEKLNGTVLWWAVMFRDGAVCHYCRGHADTVDHLIPRSAGGLDEPSNLVAACRECNLEKRTTPALGVVTPPLTELHMAAAKRARRMHRYPPKGQLRKVVAGGCEHDGGSCDEARACGAG